MPPMNDRPRDVTLLDLVFRAPDSPIPQEIIDGLAGAAN
jgi:hypothetical protein